MKVLFLNVFLNMCALLDKLSLCLRFALTKFYIFKKLNYTIYSIN